MAGLKKPSRKKDSTSPNLVLVIFLVFFILLSIGLGVWGYYGYADKEKLVNDVKVAKTAKTATENYSKFLEVAFMDSMQMLGTPLDPNQLATLDVTRTALAGDDSKWPKEDLAPVFKKNMEDNKKILGFDGKKYTEEYPKKVAVLLAEVKAKDGKINELQGQLDAANAQFSKLQAAQDEHFKKIAAMIGSGIDVAQKDSRKGSDFVKDLIAENSKLDKQIKENAEVSDRDKLARDRQIRELKKQLAEREAQREQLVSPTRNPGDVHALLLDISSGKPLWDRPQGKIIRVDMSQRQVVLNLGSANGVQPELTFSIFGASPYGTAEKYLKGSVEVTRVLDSNTSLARIIALYEPNGQEVLLNDPGVTRIQRESESALRAGDLLFNMFWGNRVAIAGPVSLTGTITNSPAEQMRRLTDFGAFLERQGMPVDCYLDLAAQKSEGKITQDTRYLIMADNLHTEGPGVDGERAKAVNELMAGMRKDAVEKGLFVISAENFLNVIGYRRPRSASQQENHSFSPSLLKAGVAVPPVLMPDRGLASSRTRTLLRPPAAPAPEAKEEKKDKE